MGSIWTVFDKSHPDLQLQESVVYVQIGIKVDIGSHFGSNIPSNLDDRSVDIFDYPI